MRACRTLADATAMIADARPLSADNLRGYLLRDVAGAQHRFYQHMRYDAEKHVYLSPRARRIYRFHVAAAAAHFIDIADLFFSRRDAYA